MTETATPPTTCCSPPPAQTSLDDDTAVELATRFKALGDPNRLLLLATIAAGDTSEACVCDLTEPLGLGQPTVSHHLKILVDAGFLTREKRGTWSYYSVVPGTLKNLCQSLCAESALGGMMDSGASAQKEACC
ncbi:ArsR/SmtB family transcription factor [Nesterenkonia muleiensis]|uniref:ArsR/SmtB family transcription factor n=1 Tax=Nesterenkonia muleiensis TaxID=2282648 RepID=UPI000E72E383|nr:metalloregulator ArsR/SmtB family transcription factor [Nesterenkonia muleiensis]